MARRLCRPLPATGDPLALAAAEAAAARARRLERRSALAASFVAVLELARQGRLAVAQRQGGGPLMVHPDARAPMDEIPTDDEEGGDER